MWIRSISTRPSAGGVHQTGGRSRLSVKEDVIKRDLGRVLLQLEELQDEQIRKALEPIEAGSRDERRGTRAGIGLLQATESARAHPRRLRRCGMVGEETNKLAGYLAAVSRKLETPLAVVVQSSSPPARAR